MQKTVFTYEVAQDKQDEYIKATKEVIKPFWESHGCVSYHVWQSQQIPTHFRKEMLFENGASPQPDAKTADVVALYNSFASNVSRESFVQVV
jgi:hypothetical protein